MTRPPLACCRQDAPRSGARFVRPGGAVVGQCHAGEAHRTPYVALGGRTRQGHALREPWSFWMSRVPPTPAARARTLPVSGGPQATDYRTGRKPALWAVRSTGLLGAASHGTASDADSINGEVVTHVPFQRWPDSLEIQLKAPGLEPSRLCDLVTDRADISALEPFCLQLYEWANNVARRQAG